MYDLVDLVFTGLVLLVFVFCFLALVSTGFWQSPGLSIKACMLFYLRDFTLPQLLHSGRYGIVEELAHTCGARQVAIYRNGVLVYGSVVPEKCMVLTSVQVPVPDRHIVYSIILCR